MIGKKPIKKKVRRKKIKIKITRTKIDIKIKSYQILSDKIKKKSKQNIYQLKN